MAATAWTVYRSAKFKLGNTLLDLAGGIFKIQLHTSASNASLSDATITIIGEVNNEVAAGNGYSAGGKSIANPTWSQVALTQRFDGDDVIWTATGGTIPNIKFAVIKESDGIVVCRSVLTASQFTLQQGNTLTIQMNASGIFNMV